MSIQFDIAKQIIAETCPNRKLKLENIRLFADIIQPKKYQKGLPLSFFEKKNLADLTTTIMGDCTALERTFSNAIPQLLGTIHNSQFFGLFQPVASVRTRFHCFRFLAPTFCTPYSSSTGMRIPCRSGFFLSPPQTSDERTNQRRQSDQRSLSQFHGKRIRHSCRKCHGGSTR